MDLLQQALLKTFQEDTPSALEVKCNKEHGNIWGDGVPLAPKIPVSDRWGL